MTEEEAKIAKIRIWHESEYKECVWYAYCYDRGRFEELLNQKNLSSQERKERLLRWTRLWCTTTRTLEDYAKLVEIFKYLKETPIIRTTINVFNRDVITKEIR